MKIHPKHNADFLYDKQNIEHKNNVKKSQDTEDFKSLLVSILKKYDQNNKEDLTPQQKLALDGLPLNDENIKVLKSLLY